MKVIDLFAGAGGLSLGAARAGFEVVAAVENDKQPLATHKINFPNTIHIEADIQSLSGSALREKSGLGKEKLYGVIGGPPCQGFSTIGRSDVDDSRNRLFLKFFQLLAELKPYFFVAENVPGILREKFNPLRSKAFEQVSDYVLLDPIKVAAHEYGAPTTRTRVFYIGYHKEAPIKRLTTSDIEAMKVGPTQKTNVREALEGLPLDLKAAKQSGLLKLLDEYIHPTDSRLQNSFFYERVTSKIPSGVGDLDYIRTYSSSHIVNGCWPTVHKKEVSDRYAKVAKGGRDDISKSPALHPDAYCPTLRAGTGPEKGSYQAVRPIHYELARVITPREAARLQGFPDWFKLPDTIWHGFRQIGNSVSPIVAEQILSVIHQKLTK